MKPGFFIHTTGCKANQWDSSVISANLKEAGLDPASQNEASLVIVNGCTVTLGAVRDIRRFINRLRRENPSARIVLAGCHAQVYPDDNFGADVVLGQTEKFSIVQYIDSHGSFVSSRDALEMEKMPRDPVIQGKTRFFLKIQDGCDRFCSYCIVPFARGVPRSRSFKEIRSVMERLAGNGVQEVVLTGIEISAWHDREYGYGFVDLLRALNDLTSPRRIRLSSIDPLMFNDDFITVAARSPKIARSFHIPLQSASDRILDAMGRPYRVHYIRALLDKLLAKIPDAGIGMDVITGFPGEDEKCFEETRDFLDSAGIYYLHVFPFSPRPGTRAASMGGAIPEKEKKSRVKELKMLDAGKREAFHRRFVGTRALIIPESKRYLGRYMRGYTENYIPVHIPYDKLYENKVIAVNIDRIESGAVIGRTIRE
ncbi:MAG: MiaB family protein, involved in tRNA or rRNA modification [Deltaproteobacteria bacterium]|nr:MiaB family protein, involved in tRNA or rRNA modification [Deltaproteobacteria bacterium]